MIKVTTYFRSESKDKSHGYIWVKFYVSSEKVNFSTHVKCEKLHWNDEKAIIRSADKEAKDKNLIIKNILSRINDVEVKYRLKNKKMTRDGFMKAYNRPDDYDTFYEFCEAYQKEVSYLEEGTIKNHNKALNKLKEFNPDLTFDDIDHDFIVKYFNQHLLKTEKNKLTTAYKDMANLKKYIRAAMRKGYIETNPFAEFKIRKVDGDFSYLTKEELRKLLKLYYSGVLEPDQYKTLQFFLYTCFSSQHVTDALKTNIEDISGGVLTYYRIKNRNRKPEKVEVSTSEMFKSILSDIVGFRKNGPVFMDMPAEQTMNRYLKSFCKRDGIDINKDISIKTGRHTFATLYLSETKDLHALKEEMGHSDIRETLKYAHVLDTDKRKNIHCFDQFMDEKPL